MTDRVYGADIYTFMREQEPSFSIDIDIVNTRVRSEDRYILVQWLMEVCAEFEFSSWTFWLALDLFEHVIAVRHVMKTDFQLVLTTCICLAAKHEEPKTPSLSIYSQATDYSWNKQELRREETRIFFKDLHCKISIPTVWEFINIHIGLAYEEPSENTIFLGPRTIYTGTGISSRAGSLAGYILKYWAHIECIPFHPSILAAATLIYCMIAVHMSITPYKKSTTREIAVEQWTNPRILSHCDYTFSDLHACISELHIMHQSAVVLLSPNATKFKFLREKYQDVIEIRPLIKPFNFPESSSPNKRLCQH